MRKVLVALLAVLGLASAQKLVLASWGSQEEIQAYQQVLRVFQERNPGIQVEYINIPSNEYLAKITAMMAAGSPPDIFFINNIDFPGLASRGVLKPLDPFIQRDKYPTGDIFPGILKAFQWEGAQYGLPRDVSNLVVFYNRNLLRKAGLPDPKPDWTWDDFLRYAKALTVEKDGKRVQWGVSFQTFYLFWEPWVWSAGGRFYSPDHSKFLLNSPPSLEGLQFYLDLRYKHHVAPTPEEAQDRGAFTMFLNGQTGMIVDGRWRVPTLKARAKFDFDVVPFPRGKAGSIVDIDGSGWVMAAGTRNPEAAWKLLSFLAGPEAIQIFTKTGLIIPARGVDVKNVEKSIQNLKDFFVPPPPKSQHFFLTVNKTARPTETFERWNEALQLINKALEPVWQGKAELKAALDGVAPQVQKILDEVQAERKKR
ncbi:sugar ABC transporter substrate-binding protein [Thermus sp.]|uniref:ABC transporter substrate-binding protein n=1 Tax=Thermus sp. TaxID=275 RepID=UPI0028CEF8A4|nr:sugar ABC transporter substrate-binding protein [Thermus sp.]MDT7908797.1 sugar ABC transporter substrate-binding protein [Thermus sp.]